MQGAEQAEGKASDDLECWPSLRLSILRSIVALNPTPSKIARCLPAACVHFRYLSDPRRVSLFLRLPISRSRPGDFCPRWSYRKTLFERVLDAFPRAGVEGEKDRTKLKDPEHPYRRNAIECLGALVKFFPLNVAPR